jgi:hypothetical protein
MFAELRSPNSDDFKRQPKAAAPILFFSARIDCGETEVGRAKREIGLEQDADQSVKETGNSL